MSALEIRDAEREAAAINVDPALQLQLIRYFAAQRARQTGLQTIIECGTEIYHTRRLGPGKTLEQHYVLTDAIEMKPKRWRSLMGGSDGTACP